MEAAAEAAEVAMCGIVGAVSPRNVVPVLFSAAGRVPPGARVGVTLERAPPSERPSRPLRLVAVRSGS